MAAKNTTSTGTKGLERAQNTLSVALWAVCALGGCTPDPDPDPGESETFYLEEDLVPVELNDNGAWSWFMDDRVIIHDGELIVGSVRSLGGFSSTMDLEGWGNVEIASYDLDDGEVDKVVLHERFEQDDHDNPAFLPIEGGGLLAVYSKHAQDRTVYSRTSAPDSAMVWSGAQLFVSPGEDSDWAGDNVTYANLFRWPGGRIYNFYRGFDHDPNYMYSDDEGASWTYGGRMLQGYDGYSPYMRYAYDGKGKLHFIATEDHPRNHDTSIFHGYLQDGIIHDSSGVELADLSETTDVGLSVWDLTMVYPGDEDHVAWTVDMELDAQERPYITFSVQRDGAGVPRWDGGFDLRYHYGRWDGSEWSTEEIAYAGTRLYSGEDDYSGLAALDPHDPHVIYISTDADPTEGTPLISAVDGQRHYELFRGRAGGAGQPWEWEPLTFDSTVDNLRPIVPKWDDERTALVWMRGEYTNNRGNWTTKVMALILP